MARQVPANPAFGIAVFVLFGLALIFLAVLPLGPSHGGIPGPDILLAMTMVYVVRRPDLVPVWVIAGVFLLADLMVMRAPGLMAAAVVLAAEYLKLRKDMTHEVPFIAEWGVGASMIACVIVGTSAVLVLVGSPAPPLGAMMIKLVFTVLAYPAMVIVLRIILGIGRAEKNLDVRFGARS